MRCSVHEAVREYVRAHLPDKYGSVLEVGSRDINGGVWGLLRPPVAYTGVDIQAGRGVDVVADFADYQHATPVDLILCLEVLEHSPKWRAIVASAARNLKPGGTLILTCATTGRAPHSARSEDPIQADEFYENITKEDLDAELARHFGRSVSEVVGTDLRAVAIKNRMPRWNVIIPSCSDLKITERFAEFMECFPEFSRERIIVVSDGLSMRTKRVLRGVRWVDGKKPFVFAEAINAGAKAADHDADIVILGDDVQLGYPYSVAALARASFGAAVVVPEVTGVCGQPAQRAGRTETTANWVAFICAYIPRKVWDAVGGLDERFTGYGYDDVDWCRRAAGHGEIRIAHNVTVNHLDHSSFRSDPGWPQLYQQNRTKYEAKWAGEARV